MHTLAQLHYLTRKEFERNLHGLTDGDARKRVQPMNCISWIIAHVADQHRAFFVDWPAGSETPPRYRLYGYGSAALQPPLQPPLEEAMTLWRDACKEADVWLQASTRESLQEMCDVSPDGESWGHSSGALYLPYLVPPRGDQLRTADTRPPAARVRRHACLVL